MFERLDQDITLLQENLFNRQKVILTNISNSGDTHRLGRSTRILTFISTEEGKEYKCIYNPRPSQIDVEFQSFFSWLKESSGINVHTHQIIDREEYAWCEFVNYQQCETQADIEEYYYNLGAMLALVYAFSGCDLHLENIIAHGKYPVIVDYECFFTPSFHRLAGRNAQPCTFVSDSLILPCRAFASDEHQGIDMSAASGNGGQESPIASSYWENKGTDTMKMAKKYLAMTEAENLPKLNGQNVAILEYKTHFQQGFKVMYHFFMDNKALLLSNQSPLQFFKNLTVRVLTRASSEYAQILNSTNHPKLLHIEKEYQSYAQRNLLRKEHHENYTHIVEHEKKELDHQDIPYFYTTTDSHTLYDGHNKPVNLSFIKSGFERSCSTLKSLSKDDLHLQLHLIDVSFASLTFNKNHNNNDIQKKPQLATINHFDQLIPLATRYLNKLDALKIDDGELICWPTLKIYNHSATPNFTESDLYDGVLGFMLLYAHAGELIHPDYKKTAERCLQSYLFSLSVPHYQDKLSIDGYGDLGGGIFALGQLYQLWQQPELIEHIEHLLKLGQSLIEQNKVLDIIAGAAGYLNQLLTVAPLLQGNPLFEASLDQCVEHILQHYPHPAVPYENYLFDSEQPVIGYSHGTMGIALALARYHQYKPHEKAIQWVHHALEYEASCFDQKNKNWHDLRGEDLGIKHGDHCNVSWCHGSLGISLSRLQLAQLLDNSELMQECKFALETTLHKMTEQSGRSLCHGLIGSTEIILQAHQHDFISHEDYFQHINTLITLTLAGESSDPQRSCPGLMLGDAGIAYQLLRLAQPNAVSSVLI